MGVEGMTEIELYDLSGIHKGNILSGWNSDGEEVDLGIVRHVDDYTITTRRITILDRLNWKLAEWWKRFVVWLGKNNHTDEQQ